MYIKLIVTNTPLHGQYKFIIRWILFFFLVLHNKCHAKLLFAFESVLFQLGVSSSTHLAVNVVIFSKHKPASDTRSEESVRLELLPLYVLLNCLQTFIREHEAGQVPGVGVSGLSYRSKLLSQTVVQVRCKYKRIIKPWTLMHNIHLIIIEYYLVRFVISIFQQSCHFDLSKVLYL